MKKNENTLSDFEQELKSLIIKSPEFLKSLFADERVAQLIRQDSEFLQKLLTTSSAIDFIEKDQSSARELLYSDRFFTQILNNSIVQQKLLSNDRVLSVLRQRSDIVQKILSEFNVGIKSKDKSTKYDISTIEAGLYYQSLFIFYWVKLNDFMSNRLRISERELFVSEIFDKISFSKALLRLLRFETKPSTINLFEKPIEVPDELSATTLIEEIFVSRDYLFNSKKENPTIIDLGGHVGLSVIFFKLTYPNSEIYVLEPSPSNAAMLKRNVKSWGFKNVIVLEKAVTEQKGQVTFYISNTDSMANTATERRMVLNDTCVKTQVESITLDSLVEFYGIKEIDFLKVDIEGSEVGALKGAGDSLNKVNSFFIEYHGGGLKNTNRLGDLLSILEESDFEFVVSDAVSTINRLPFTFSSLDHPFSLKIQGRKQ